MAPHSPDTNPCPQQQADANNMPHNGSPSSGLKDALCLTCGCHGASVSVYTRVGNAEPLLSLLGIVLRRPVGTIALHSDVVCARCHAHFRLMHRLMARLARLARQTTLGFNRGARCHAKQQKVCEDDCLLVVEGVEVKDIEGGIVGRALAMAATARKVTSGRKDATERKFECPVCGKKFRAYSHRVEHMLVHTGERAFHCDDCGFQASTKSNLARHRQRHNQECRCDICGKTLANKFTLKEHVRTHGEERPHQCNECKKSFLRRRELRIHERTHKSDAHCHQCPECDKTFVLRSRLTRHMLVHREEKQFICDVCKKEFARKDDLKCHERIHTGEKPYACQHCGRAFRYMSNCRSHMRVHQRLGLSCARCNMTFPTQGKYATHLKSKNHRRKCEAAEEDEEETIVGTTDDISEFTCGVCTITFDSMDQLSAHTLATHITPPILSDTPDTSIIISGMGVDGEDSVVSFSQLDGVSVVVEVDRDAAPLPMPLPSPPSTALLAGDEPPPPSPTFPFSLDGKEVVEEVGGTILASLTDGEEMVVCAREEEVGEMEEDRHEISTPITSTTSSYNNTITTTVSPSSLHHQQTVTILNSTTVFKLADWDPNE